MLTDKHIIQYSGYLMEDLPNYEALIKDEGLDKVILEIYKKGYQDCLDELNYKPM